MSESYVINEKRELILDRVKEFIYQNGGVAVSYTHLTLPTT